MNGTAVPRVVVIAGPNGSGKSTLTQQLRAGLDEELLLPDLYLNPDELAAQLRREGVGEPEMTAFHEARRLRQVYRERAVSFAFETVFSHPSGIVDLCRLRASGYQVMLVFVCTEDAELNVARVAGRVRAGGHAVPPEKIRSRYERCLQLLPRMVEEAHSAWVFDSTERLQLCARVRGEQITAEGVPAYLQTSLLEALQQRSAARSALYELSGRPGNCSSPDESGGSYAGRIVSARLPYAYLQEIGAGQFICHDGALVRAAIQEGTWVQVSYSAGEATVCEC
jgi:predicted ABC-type ATPase